MYTIGEIECRRSSKKYNITKGYFYNAYADAITKETELENDNNEIIKLSESEYIKYF